MRTGIRRTKMSEKKTTPMEVTDKERKMIELARSIDFGQMLITIKHGSPICVEGIRKSIDLS